MISCISGSMGDDDFDEFFRGLKIAKTDRCLLGVLFADKPPPLFSLSRLLLRDRSRGLSNRIEMALFLRWPLGESGLAASFDLNNEQNELFREILTAVVVAGDGDRLPAFFNAPRDGLGDAVGVKC